LAAGLPCCEAPQALLASLSADLTRVTFAGGRALGGEDSLGANNGIKEKKVTRAGNTAGQTKCVVDGAMAGIHVEGFQRHDLTKPRLR